MSPMKWCTGSCGRYLPRSAFHASGDGYSQPECKGCHRVRVREYARRRYRYSAAFRRSERARVARWYAAHRAEKCAAERARHQARKLRGAAA